ncbi:MAG: hypothetical protein AMXMBFR12_06780 [Candidatus Babeliales bacterium]
MQKSPPLQVALSAQEAIDIRRQQITLLDSGSINTSQTPLLDHYKCAFILGWLKPSGKIKLYRKISDVDLGALAAQKKHMDRPLTLQEELALWKWQTYMIQKYRALSSQEFLET